MIKYDIKKISEKNIRMIPRKMVEISEQINQITAKMKGRIEKEIPDTGYFRNFAEDFENKNKNIYARAISMSIEKDENIDGHALLLLSALHPSMNIDASSMLVCGKRDDILSFMNKENFTKKVEEEIIKLYITRISSDKKEGKYPLFLYYIFIKIFILSLSLFASKASIASSIL